MQYCTSGFFIYFEITNFIKLPDLSAQDEQRPVNQKYKLKSPYRGGTPKNKHPIIKNTLKDKPNKTRHHLKQISSRKRTL